LVVDPSRCRFKLALDFKAPLVYGKPRESWVTEQGRVLPVVLLVNRAMNHETSLGSDGPIGKY
jgi:hypothetical protein